MVMTRELASAYRHVQDIAINATIKAIENAKKRRQEFNQLWQGYQQELQRTFQERVLEQAGERGEKKYDAYGRAKHGLSKGDKHGNVDASMLKNVVQEEKETQLFLEQLRRDETQEGRAIRAEIDMVQNELRELEEVLRILENARGRALSLAELQEIQMQIHQAYATLQREANTDSFLRNIEAAEGKLETRIGSFAHNMSQLEFKEAKVAKGR